MPPSSRKTVSGRHGYLVKVGGILSCKLQLFDDDLVRPHPLVTHAFQQRFEVSVIQTATRSANQGRVHMRVGL